MIIEKIETLSNALSELKNRNIQFEKIIHFPVYRGRFYSCAEEKKDGIHLHFMVGNCDVAYYTPIMKVLFILDKPRLWDENLLNKAEVLN